MFLDFLENSISVIKLSAYVLTRYLPQRPMLAHHRPNTLTLLTQSGLTCHYDFPWRLALFKTVKIASKSHQHDAVSHPNPKVNIPTGPAASAIFVKNLRSSILQLPCTTRRSTIDIQVSVQHVWAATWVSPCRSKTCVISPQIARCAGCASCKEFDTRILGTEWRRPASRCCPLRSPRKDRRQALEAEERSRDP